MKKGLHPQPFLCQMVSWSTTDEGLRFPNNGIGIQSIFRHQLARGSTFTKLIFDSHESHGRGVVGSQCLRHTASKAAEALMLFGHQNGPGLLR